MVRFEPQKIFEIVSLKVLKSHDVKWQKKIKNFEADSQLNGYLGSLERTSRGSRR
jgi:hypothetical protein